jgi:HNH endonuclease
MDAATRELVRRRAAERCEYCHLRQEDSELAHHVEHIVAKQHGGSDDPNNLALACHRCNLHKGPNLTGIDSRTGQVAALFHPRNDRCSDHFVLNGLRIEGISETGCATVHVLAINDARRVEVRQEIGGLA